MSDKPPEPPKVEIDHPGWWAIRHRDGWWLGTEEGVLCYEDYDFARVAMTLRWQMDHSQQPFGYSIKKWPGPTVAGREIENRKTALQAIIDYEK